MWRRPACKASHVDDSALYRKSGEPSSTPARDARARCASSRDTSCALREASPPLLHTQPLRFQGGVWGCDLGTRKAGAGRGPGGHAVHQSDSRGCCSSECVQGSQPLSEPYLAKVTEAGVRAIPSWVRADLPPACPSLWPQPGPPTSTPADFTFQISPGIPSCTRHSPTELGTR